MKKILIVLGTRPEAVKMASLIREMKAKPEEFKLKVCVTGQHRQMLDQVLAIFSITPDYDLNLMKPNQTLFDITANAIIGMRVVLEQEKPDIVMVQGDTTTVFAGALAAFYMKIPVGHVEAGLRTNNKFSPFPEEINRRLTSVLTDYHFVPTSTAKENLLREGVNEERIYVTGNTVIDALLWAKEMIQGKTEKDFPELKDLIFQRQIVLITGHRRENLGQGFENICHAIKQLAQRYPHVDWVYPVHMNPNVREPVYKIIGGIKNVRLIEPLTYLPFIYLMMKSYFILTDSGGVQEEAPSLGKPVLVMRETTERPEAVIAGTVKLVGTNQDLIVQECVNLMENEEAYHRMSQAQNPYGDGKASRRISLILSGQSWESFANILNLRD
jgi:UDP-N-acetylglucosamine 2-epimerase (non-hydrolysing)